MELNWRTYDLVLKDPFTISRGTITLQPTLVVSVEHDGVVGYGEATENSFYEASIQSMQAKLEGVRSILKRHSPLHPAELWIELDPLFQSSRFAQCAIDCAIWDLWGKVQNVSVPELLLNEMGHPRNLQSITSSYTIGIAEPHEMVRKLRAVPNWPAYKIKVGTPQDLEILRLLRQETRRPFRVDANCGWSFDDAWEILPELEGLAVEFVEQPLSVDHPRMCELREASPLPLIADESCEEEEDVGRCVGAFDGINIKLVKCGGLTPAIRMVREAKRLGMKLMVGCMTESSIGISAAAQLLPWLDYADLDGAALLAEDIAEGVCVVDGQVQFNDLPGLGIVLKATKATNQRSF